MIIFYRKLFRRIVENASSRALLPTILWTIETYYTSDGHIMNTQSTIQCSGGSVRTTWKPFKETVSDFESLTTMASGLWSVVFGLRSPVSTLWSVIFWLTADLQSNHNSAEYKSWTRQPCEMLPKIYTLSISLSLSKWRDF